VAVCDLRAVFIEPVGLQVPLAGSYTSALARSPLVTLHVTDLGF
jgi:hypothetical protein